MGTREEIEPIADEATRSAEMNAGTLHPRLGRRPARRAESLEARRQAELLAKYFRGLTDVTRLRILDLLIREGELNVSELVERLGQPQGRVSSHLACLRDCGYVSARREGKFVYYRVADQRVPLLLALAKDMLADHAEAIIACTRM